MRKLLLILLFPLLAHAQYIPAGSGTWLRTPDSKNWATGFSTSLRLWYQAPQVDSLFLNVPTQSILDSTHKAMNTELLHLYAAANAIYFSSQYFYNSGVSGLPLKVGNSDSLGHQGPPYYLNYNNLTNKPTIYSFTGNSSQYTTGAGLYVTFPTNVSQFANDAGYATVTQVKVSFNGALFGQTASQANAGTFPNTGGDNTFLVSAWVNLLAATSDSLKVQVTWTDGHSVSHTKIFKGTGVSSTGNMGTVDDYALFSVSLRAKDATSVVVSSTVSGAGSILYEIGSVIEKKVGNGGL